MPAAKTKVRASYGLRQLLTNDPGQFLLFAFEHVQVQAHPRRLPRVLRRTQRRYEAAGWLHVGHMYEPCDAVLAACMLGYKLKHTEVITPQKQRIFDNGTYMHFRFQNVFLSLGGPFQVEVAKVLRRWPIIGEADVTVSHPELGTRPVVVELKSMNDQQFKALKAPVTDHELQAMSYTALGQYEESLQVWYENKNTQEVKTFVPGYTYERYHRREVFDEAFGRALYIGGIVAEGQLPRPCGKCDFDKMIGTFRDVEPRIMRLREERKHATAA